MTRTGPRSHATSHREPGQGRKAAAISGLRRVPWPSRGLVRDTHGGAAFGVGSPVHSRASRPGCAVSHPRVRLWSPSAHPSSIRRKATQWRTSRSTASQDRPPSPRWSASTTSRPRWPGPSTRGRGTTRTSSRGRGGRARPPARASSRWHSTPPRARPPPRIRTTRSSARSATARRRTSSRSTRPATTRSRTFATSSTGWPSPPPSRGRRSTSSTSATC